MQHTYFKIWIHLIWSTKDRNPIMRDEFRKEIFIHIRDKARELGYHIDVINGIADHLHCLISLNPKFSISEVVDRLKGESSHWVNYQDFMPEKFVWQRGFSAFSVSETKVRFIRKYILNQEEHHKKITFTEEKKDLLKENNIELD